MKIAATYDNGNIFQHFGKTEFFKVYEVEDNKVVSSEVIGSNGTGHGALAGLLAEQGISVLICGGIGGGAQSALAEAGIELCSGAQGDADAAVEAYLKGELVSTGVNCDHHHEEDIPAEAMKMDTPAADMRKDIPVETVVADVVPSRLSQVLMLEKPAVPITEEHLTMEHSSILPMTVANRWNSSAEPVR